MKFRKLHKKHTFFLFLSLLGMGIACNGITPQASSGEKRIPIIRSFPGKVHTKPNAFKQFGISTNPSVGSFDQGILTIKKPGITSIFHCARGKIHRQLIEVPGLLPTNPYLSLGQKIVIHPFQIPRDEIIDWTSSNPGVASVDKEGVISANSCGLATIHCVTKAGTIYTDTIDVVTEEQASSLKRDPVSVVLSSEYSTLLMKKGDSFRLKVTARKGNTVHTNSALHWSSEDSSIASVNAVGDVKAKKDGYTTITAECEGTSISFSVNVITSGESGNSCHLTLLTGNDNRKRNYLLFKQNAHNYSSYDRYLAWHGCAHCSFATVLGAYNKSYTDILPNEVISGIEKEYAPAEAWSREHEEHSLPHQMPLSLHGISELLTKGEVKNEYVPSFTYDSAKRDIINHLKTGNPVIMEVRQKSAKTKKSSKRWTNSYHTMIFLGIYTDNHHVLLCDSVDRSWYNGGQRYKIVTLDDVMEYMFSSTETTTSYYYDGAASDGGYIKIYPEEE